MATATAKKPSAEKTPRARKAATSGDKPTVTRARKAVAPKAAAAKVAKPVAKSDDTPLGRSLDLLASLVKSDPESTGFKAARTRATRFLAQNGRAPA